MTLELFLMFGKVQKFNPFLRKAPKWQASYYHPIAIVLKISKVLEKIIKYEIYKYLEKHSIIHVGNNHLQIY